MFTPELKRQLWEVLWMSVQLHVADVKRLDHARVQWDFVQNINNLNPTKIHCMCTFHLCIHSCCNAMHARLLIPHKRVLHCSPEILNRLAYHYNNSVVESLFWLIICQNLALTKITTTCPVVNCGPPHLFCCLFLDILVDLFIFEQGNFPPTLPLTQVKPQQCYFSLMFRPVV